MRAGPVSPAVLRNTENVTEKHESVKSCEVILYHLLHQRQDSPAPPCYATLITCPKNTNLSRVTKSAYTYRKCTYRKCTYRKCTYRK